MMFLGDLFIGNDDQLPAHPGGALGQAARMRGRARKRGRIPIQDKNDAEACCDTTKSGSDPVFVVSGAGRAGFGSQGTGELALQGKLGSEPDFELPQFAPARQLS